MYDPPDGSPPASDLPDPDEDDPDADPDFLARKSCSKLLAQRGFEDTLILPREQAPEVCHERRLKIIDYLTENEPSSVSALSRALGYNKGEMSRDLRNLANVDVVELEQVGKSKVPRLKHSRIVIEPIVSPDSDRSPEE